MPHPAVAAPIKSTASKTVLVPITAIRFGVTPAPMFFYGGDGGDTIDGKGGDDVLYGEDGLDVLWGARGADTFVLEDTTAFNDVDVIKDFDDSTDNDVLDISDILDNTSYNHGVDAITDWVEITTNGSDSEVRVDTTGSASFGSGTHIATLEGITGLTDEAALVSSGNLIVA